MEREWEKTDFNGLVRAPGFIQGEEKKYTNTTHREKKIPDIWLKAIGEKRSLNFLELWWVSAKKSKTPFTTPDPKGNTLGGQPNPRDTR